MAWSESSLTTEWVTPVRIPNGENLTLKDIQNALQEQCDAAGIPVAFTADTIKKGGLFNKQTEDALFMYNPQHREYLKFIIRLMHQGRYAFLHVYNMGGSENYGHENSKSSIRGIANLIGGHKAKLEAEEQYYAILQDCIASIFS